ncbi:cytochrome P450 [Halobium palmae]|uniref:Cytochrome P450 n=1 Tax=Halobium palmae TaxID=1776492 RepID=A0ABD5RZH2_9EURY
MSTEPPGPNGVPLLGNTGQYARDPFSFMTAVGDAYGDLAQFELGPIDVYMLTNPDDVERVLVGEHEKFRKPEFQDDAMGDLLGEGLLLSEGDTWERQRDLAQPAFHMQRLTSLAPTMTRKTEATLDGWRDGDVVDVEIEMARLTVDIIVSAMFGTEIDEATVERVQENLEPLGQRFEPDPLRFLLPDWVPTEENRKFSAAVDELEAVIDDLVERRRGTERGDGSPAEESGEGTDDGPPMDLLSIILRARERGEQSRENLRDEMMTMLLAGHDTTALTLTYLWYLLSEHPEVEKRVHEELDEVLGGSVPTATDARRLEYLERVLLETMRLYPPVYVLFREAKTGVRLGGYRVPKGSTVMLPQWVVHRSERWYDDPLAFDPDRWLPERRSERPQFSYFPFGGGPRHCIGMQFSLLEAKLIVGTVAQRFSLAYARDEPFDLRGSLTMHPADGMEMRLVER